MATQKGIGVVWGIGTANVSAGTGVLRPTRQALSKEVEIVEHRDASGEVVGVTSFNGTRTLSMDLYPAGTTLATAADAAANLPASGSTVALVDSRDSEINATWYVVSCTRTITNTDKMTAALELKRWDSISSYTTIS